MRMPWPDNGQAVLLTRQGTIITASLVDKATFTMTHSGSSGVVTVKVEGTLEPGGQQFISLNDELEVGR